MNKVHYSHLTVEHPTPQDFFDKLNARYHFTLDPCATAKSAKCKLFYTKRTNGLGKDWGVHRVFMNPPYGNPEHPCRPKCSKKKCVERGHHIRRYVPGIADWVEKAATSAQAGALVVCLLPARTDTAWWHEYIWDEELNRPRQGVEIEYVKGRLKFGALDGPAPFPNVVVVFNPPVMRRYPRVEGCALQGLEVRP